MASDEAAGHERTEQPTSKRREDARRQGRVAVSPDLTAACALLGAFGVHALAGGRFLSDAALVMERWLAVLPHTDLTVDGSLALLVEATRTTVRLAWPFVVIPALVVVAAQFFQTRLVFSGQALRPRWERLNPLEGLRRLLGVQGLVALLKSLLKLTLVGTVAYLTLRADWPALVLVAQGGHEATLATVGGVVGRLWLRVAAAYLALAALDYGYQWWRHETSLRMTREELRQETKEQEGNPTLRGRMRAIHRQMATRRMMSEVKRADVVLRNPTHVAVALRYDQARMRAPRVVAKGERLVALRIIDEARRHAVPVVENRPLARALFKAVALGREVPQDLYRAVAEVLAHVYALRRGGR